MRAANAQESTDSPITAAQIQPIWEAPATNRPPAMVPIRIAMKVAPSTSALPVASSDTWSWSGRMAYFTGPNSAATVPNSASATNKSGIECMKKPAAAKQAAKISMNFSRRATTDLTYLSANSPPSADSTKKGKMKTAPATVTSDALCSAATPYSNMMTSAFFRTLSFSAEQNWAQNS